MALLIRGCCNFADEMLPDSSKYRLTAFAQQIYFELPYYLFLIVIISIIFQHWLLLKTVQLVADGDLVIDEEGLV